MIGYVQLWPYRGGQKLHVELNKKCNLKYKVHTFVGPTTKNGHPANFFVFHAIFVNFTKYFGVSSFYLTESAVIFLIRYNKSHKVILSKLMLNLEKMHSFLFPSIYIKKHDGF